MVESSDVMLAPDQSATSARWFPHSPVADPQALPRTAATLGSVQVSPGPDAATDRELKRDLSRTFVRGRGTPHRGASVCGWEQSHPATSGPKPLGLGASLLTGRTRLMRFMLLAASLGLTAARWLRPRRRGLCIGGTTHERRTNGPR